MNKFVCYAHYRASDGIMFYVGIGAERRPYETGRNRHWHNVAAKHGYYVEVLAERLTWDVACELEKIMIASFRSDSMVGKANLTNQTDGGEGTRGWGRGGASENPERVRKNAESNRRLAADPEWRKNVAEAMKKLATDPEWIRKNAAVLKRLHDDPEIRRKVGGLGKRNAADPEWQRNHSEALKRMHADPEIRRKKAKAIRASIPLAMHNAVQQRLPHTSLWPRIP